MRILASGDHHWHQAGPRWEECCRIHDWIVEKVDDVRPDLFLSAGDVYEKASTPLERLHVANWLLKIADVCPVVIVKGNHDAARDLAPLAKLRSTHSITVEEQCGVIHVADGAIGCLAWPDRATLTSGLDAMPSENVDDVARDLISVMMRSIRSDWLDFEGPKVLLTHAMIDGSVTSVGQPLIGQEFNVGLAELGLSGADVVIAGHVHKPQEWEHEGMPVLYTGSPFRTAFGETEDKSILQVDVTPSGVLCQRLNTPARRMELLDAVFHAETGVLTRFGSEGTGQRLEPGGLTGAEVRLRYTVETEHREAAAVHAKEWRDKALAAGAYSIKVEAETVARFRARESRVAHAHTLEEKLDALWDARDNQPAPEQRQRLLDKAHQLQDDAA